MNFLLFLSFSESETFAQKTVLFPAKEIIAQTPQSDERPRLLAAIIFTITYFIYQSYNLRILTLCINYFNESNILITFVDRNHNFSK